MMIPPTAWRCHKENALKPVNLPQTADEDTGAATGIESEIVSGKITGIVKGIAGGRSGRRQQRRAPPPPREGRDEKFPRGFEEAS